MLWLIPAVGIIGVEGDRFDLFYLGVLALGIGGAVVARLRPDAWCGRCSPWSPPWPCSPWSH